MSKSDHGHSSNTRNQGWTLGQGGNVNTRTLKKIKITTVSRDLPLFWFDGSLVVVVVVVSSSSSSTCDRAASATPSSMLLPGPLPRSFTLSLEPLVDATCATSSRIDPIRCCAATSCCACAALIGPLTHSGSGSTQGILVS